VTSAELRRERVDLSAMTQSIAAELQQRDSTREVEFAIEPDVIAGGDSALLHSAMSNLLENAWKFTGKHPRARIEFGEMEKAGTTVYFVKDDGAGFDLASSKRMFQAFHRLHKTSEFQGSGIGLATVARIVKRHGGRLWAESSVEQGATFYFSLTPDNVSQGG
jgi:light-regulated signal transduction histidine kinase (bacteriophytochrome)